MSSHSFELREEEKPATPVVELKKRFESRKLDPDDKPKQPRMGEAYQELQVSRFATLYEGCIVTAVVWFRRSRRM
jgi:hypothetical protein